MQKDLNKRLRLDKINWAEVILGLEGKTTFRAHDIKRALRKTGRSFNDNGPFRAVVKDFIEALGDTVTHVLDRNSNEVVYTITSTEAALKAVGHKTTPIKVKPTSVALPIGAASAGIGAMEVQKPIEPKTPDEDKIRGLFKRSYLALEHAIYLLAVYIHRAETTISGTIIKTELTDLGVNFSTLTSASRPTIKKIFELLGYNPLVVINNGPNGTTWKLEGPKELLDEYTHLSDIYEKLTGRKSKNLDDYITSAPSTQKEAERRYELLKEIEESQKSLPREPRVEKDPEIMWKKWLLISSSRYYLGASQKVSNLVSWIKINRHYEIDEEEAKKLYRELMEDSDHELQYHPSSDYVILTENGWKRLSKFYSPTQFKETILVKLPLSLENASTAFTGLTFKLDETTTSGMYLYAVEIDRSMVCEISLKKLLRFINISGKVYTDLSWMVQRVRGIIEKENSKETSKNTLIMSLEK